jgi:hypothetical protein
VAHGQRGVRQREAPLADQITDFLQEKFNAIDRDLGPQIVGDWLLVSEVVTADGRRGLRVFDSDLPLWRKLGLLTYLQQDAQTEASSATSWTTRRMTHELHG